MASPVRSSIVIIMRKGRRRVKVYKVYKVDKVDEMKLVESYTLKISETLKHHVEKLSPDDKKRMNMQMMETMERTIHMANFKPGMYSEDEVQ